MVNHETIAQELVERHEGLSKKDALDYVLSMIDIIEENVLLGESVKLHKSMIIETKEMKAKVAYDGLSKRYFDKPASKALRVRPLTRLSNKMKEQK